jgi:hypothetical protein
MAPEDPDSPEAGDELGVMVQTCVDHLGCLLGALVVPERGVAICKAPLGQRPQVEILTKIHRHLLNWSQLQRRNLVINKIKVRPIELPPYKILCAGAPRLGPRARLPRDVPRRERAEPIRAPSGSPSSWRARRRQSCRPTTIRSPRSSPARHSRPGARAARLAPPPGARMRAVWTWIACTSSTTTSACTSVTS